jgi:hypothetical protein
VTDESDKTQRIRDKISASQARAKGTGSPRKAKTSKSDYRPSNSQGTTFTQLVEDHPLAMVAGGLVLGAAVAAILPAAFGRRLSSRLAGIATVAGELGTIYGSKALDIAAEAGRAGQEKLGELSEDFAETSAEARRRASDLSSQATRRAVDLGSDAGRRAGKLAEEATRSARDAGGTAFKALLDLAGKVRH